MWKQDSKLKSYLICRKQWSTQQKQPYFLRQRFAPIILNLAARNLVWCLYWFINSTAACEAYPVERQFGITGIRIQNSPAYLVVCFPDDHLECDLNARRIQCRGEDVDSEDMWLVMARSPDFWDSGLSWLWLQDVPVFCIREDQLFLLPFLLFYTSVHFFFLLQLACAAKLYSSRGPFPLSDVLSCFFSLKVYWCWH